MNDQEIFNRVSKEITNQIRLFSAKHDVSQIKPYFRGHADSSWEMKPSIERCKKAESEVICSAIEHNKWKKEKPLFENIAHLQHYGYPTRFLDFTTEDAVALFFACMEKPDKDAEIAIVFSDSRSANMMDTAIITELSMLTGEIRVPDFCNMISGKYLHVFPEVVDDEYLMMTVLSWLDHGFIVEPTKQEFESIAKWNKRIERQKGAFFVFGNRTKNGYRTASTIEARQCTIIPKPAEAPDLISSDDYRIRIPIHREDKSAIIRELRKKGICEDYLFPV